MRGVRRLEPLRDRRRAAACLLGVAGAAAALWQAPDSFRFAEDRVAAHGATPRAQRELLAGRAYDLDTEFFAAAAREIPPGASYLVLTGPRVRVSSPLALAKVPVFAGYYLLPRRRTGDPTLADWIVSYGGDPGTLALRYVRRIVVQPGYELAQVRR